MKIIEDFISRENRRYNLKIGTVIASSLTGFVAGVVGASLFWYILLSSLTK